MWKCSQITKISAYMYVKLSLAGHENIRCGQCSRNFLYSRSSQTFPHCILFHLKGVGHNSESYIFGDMPLFYLKILSRMIAPDRQELVLHVVLSCYKPGGLLSLWSRSHMQFKCSLIEIGTWFFHATHHLDIPNTSAKLYGNPLMQYKVMAQTKKTRDAQTDGQMDGAILNLLPATII